MQWETWQDVLGGSASKNHPALGGGVGIWLYQLAGLAEEAQPGTKLVLQPLRRTLDRLPAAELTVATPAGTVSFSWQASAGRVDGLPRRRAGLWLSASFEAALTLPAGSQTTELRVPIPPAGGRGSQG